MPSDNRPSPGPLLQEKRDYIFGLLVECPTREPKDCPLEPQRKLSLKERLEWAKTLSEAEADKIIAAHKNCLKDRGLH